MVLNSGEGASQIDRNADGRVGVDEAAAEIAHLVKDSAKAEAAVIRQKAAGIGQKLRGAGNAAVAAALLLQVECVRRLPRPSLTTSHLLLLL